MKNIVALCLCLAAVGCSTTPAARMDKALQAEGAGKAQVQTCRKVVRTGSNIAREECTTPGERDQERASSQDFLDNNVLRPETAPISRGER